MNAKLKTKPIILAVPLPLLEDLDQAALALKMPRTQLILRSLRRDLKAMLSHEVIKARQQSKEFEMSCCRFRRHHP